MIDRSATMLDLAVRKPAIPPMRHFSMVLAVVILFAASGIGDPALSASSKRSVDMEIGLPSGGKPHVIVPEGEGVILPLPDRRNFGFVPVIRDGTTRPVVVVTIWEVEKKSSRRVGEVEALPEEPAVVSDTVPPFAIRILRLIMPT